MKNKLKSFEEFLLENDNNNIPQSSIRDVYPNIKKLGNNVKIGQGVIIGNNVVLDSDIIIEDDVTLESNVTITKGSIVPIGFTIPKGTKYTTLSRNVKFMSISSKLFNENLSKFMNTFKISSKNMDKFKRLMITTTTTSTGTSFLQKNVLVNIDGVGKNIQSSDSGYEFSDGDNVDVRINDDFYVNSQEKFSDFVAEVKDTISLEDNHEFPDSNITIKEFSIDGLGKLKNVNSSTWKILISFLLVADNIQMATTST